MCAMINLTAKLVDKSIFLKYIENKTDECERQK